MQATAKYGAAQLSAHAQAILASKASTKQVQNQAAMKAAKEFEAVFLNNMLENMFTGVDLEEPFGGGQAEKIFRSMQIEEYAKNLSQNGGIGLANDVYRELLAIQEGASK